MLVTKYVNFLALDGVISDEHLHRKEKFLRYWFEVLKTPLEASPSEIRQQLLTLCYSLSTKGYNDRVSHLKGFYDYLIATQQFKGVHPLLNIKRKKYHHKRRKPFSREQIDSILNYVETNPRLERDCWTYMLLIRLYIFTGCRCSELLNLRKEDFIYDPVGTCSIILRETKSGEDNEIPIPGITADKIYRNINVCKCKEYVFENRLGKKVNIHSIEKEFKRVILKLGIISPEDKGINLHTLRHSRAGRLAGNGADPYNLSALLSHEDVNTALWYIQTNVENLRRTARLDPIYKEFDRD